MVIAGLTMSVCLGRIAALSQERIDELRHARWSLSLMDEMIRKWPRAAEMWRVTLSMLRLDDWREAIVHEEVRLRRVG